MRDEAEERQCEGHEVCPELSIALLTQRFQVGGRHPAYAAIAEAEDILVASTGAELIDLSTEVSDLDIRARRAFGGTARRVRPSVLLRPVGGRSKRRFDVAVVILTSIWELPLLEAHPVVRSADEVAVWIPEVWPAQFEDARLAREPYCVADHLFVGTRGAPTVLRRAMQREAHFLTWAADVLRFKPSASAHHRPVDVLNIGRRIEPLHERLLAWASEGDRFYEYDTTVGAKVVLPKEHRDRLAALYKRSSVAVTSYPKHDVFGEACADDIPSRLWEGLAAGCIMIGRAPRVPAQRDIVGAVVVRELPADNDEAVHELERLVSQDATEERQRNLMLAHSSHDWSHRWIELFARCGWPIPERLTSRARSLERWAPAC